MYLPLGFCFLVFFVLLSSCLFLYEECPINLWVSPCCISFIPSCNHKRSEAMLHHSARCLMSTLQSTLVNLRWTSSELTGTKLSSEVSGLLFFLSFSGIQLFHLTTETYSTLHSEKQKMGLQAYTRDDSVGVSIFTFNA